MPRRIMEAPSILAACKEGTLGLEFGPIIGVAPVRVARLGKPPGWPGAATADG
ncbi:MAG: hypothetical protein ACREH9_12145 [Pseudomonadota bacterium]